LIRNRFRGFTLIEVLVVIVIIGIAVTAAIYVYSSSISRSHDARRKSDLTAISMGFKARHDAQDCSTRADIGFYPGRSLDITKTWLKVSELEAITPDAKYESCGAFSEFLATIPTDPDDAEGSFPYRFDLSVEAGLVGRHYRLTAHLENADEQELEDLARATAVWHDSFGGGNLPKGYNYIIGD